MVFVGLIFILETKLQMLGAEFGQNLVLDNSVNSKTSLSGKIILLLGECKPFLNW